MSIPGIWGTHIELIAAATLFGFSIYMMEQKCKNGHQWMCIDPLENKDLLMVPHLLLPNDVSVLSTLTHIELFYITNFHFDSVVLQTTRLTASEVPIMTGQISSIDLTQ